MESQKKIDEAIPNAIVSGIAAALTVAQAEGLISFPEGFINETRIKYRLDLCVEAFVRAVKECDPSLGD